MSQYGPWEEVFDETLADKRNLVNPLPLQAFSFESDVGRFVKFEVSNWYGICGSEIQYLIIILLLLA